MANIMIEHEWNKEDGEAVFKVVGSVVELSGNGKLPEGFSLKSVEVLKGESRAICRWEAPDVSAISELLKTVNPPTRHKISEVQKVL